MCMRQEESLLKIESDLTRAGNTSEVDQTTSNVSGIPCETSSIASVKPPHAKFRKSFANKPLSAKELEVLHWAREGKTVWEISVIRAISQATVKFHLRNIYCKLQVSNRVQAVGEAIKRGLCK